MPGTAGEIRAGKAFVELTVNNKLSRGLAIAGAELRAFGAGVRNIGLKIAGIGAVALTAALGMARVFDTMGSALHDMSDRTGMSTEALSELGYAADQSGSSIEDLEIGIRKMQKTITSAGHGSKSAVEALDALGLKAEDLAKLNPEQQFTAIAEGMSRIEDPTKRAAAAMAVLGKSGTKLLPMMLDGAKGLAEARAQAAALGLTVTTTEAALADRLGDTLGDLWKQLRQIAFVIGSALAPSLISIIEYVKPIIAGTIAWIRANSEVIVMVAKVAAVVTGAGLALVAIGAAISALGGVLTGLAAIAGAVIAPLTAIAGVAAALMTPLGAVVGLVVGLGAALLYTSGTAKAALADLMASFRDLWATASKTLGGISDALSVGDIALALRVLVQGFTVAWLQVKTKAMAVWSDIKGLIVRAGYGAWNGLLGGLDSALIAVENAWGTTINWLASAWDTLWSAIKVGADGAISDVRKLLIDLTKELYAIAGVDYGDTRAANEKAAIDAEHKKYAEDTLGGVVDRDKERDAALAKEKAAREELHRLTMVQLEAEAKKAEEAATAGDRDRLDQLDFQIEVAQDALDKAVAEAKTAADAAAAIRSESRSNPTLPDFGASIGSAIKASALGTFNTRALLGLASGDTAAARTAKATERSAQLLGNILDEVRDGAEFE